MRHSLRISVRKGQPPVVGTGKSSGRGLVYCRRFNLRERFLRLLFGERRTVTVIVPGDSVECVSVTELAKGGESDDG